MIEIESFLIIYTRINTIKHKFDVLNYYYYLTIINPSTSLCTFKFGHYNYNNKVNFQF